jgi:protein-S-isoprenylcysteine O-methyltransferase Ste14
MWLGVGAAIAVLGLGIRAVASGHVDKNAELATTGPYAYVRNPLYLGSIMIAVGFAVAARDLVIAGVIVVLFVAIYVPTIRSEEEYLRNRFTDYGAYAQAVPRLVPRTLRISGMAQGFSRELYRKHREYNAIFGAAGMLAALVVKMLWFRG